MIVGHHQVVEQLQRHLPPVTLLLGPASIGKRTLGEHLAEHHQVAPADRLAMPSPLTIAAVRATIRYLGVRPFSGFKYVTGRLDGASTAALNALLKTLEEPPDTARFVLTAERPALPTVMSRCQVFRMGLLCEGEILEILGRRGITGDQVKAGRAAVIAGGQVKPALAPRSEAAFETARDLIGAVARRDNAAFYEACKVIDEDARAMLVRLLIEAITDNWCIFRKDDTGGLYRDRQLLWQMLLALRRTPSARSRLGVRAALEAFLDRI